jgi:hypothetical protein
MFKICEQGIQLKNRIVGREAAHIFPVFKHKTVSAKTVVVQRFSLSMGLTQCTATHTVQKHHTPDRGCREGLHSMMKVKLQERNLDNVLNMDQMPIPYLYV